MSAEHEAEEHLRAIRQLMERATVYRAISAPTAFVGGLLSLGLVVGLGCWLHGDSQRELDGRWFFPLVTKLDLVTPMSAKLHFAPGAVRAVQLPGQVRSQVQLGNEGDGTRKKITCAIHFAVQS